ncbi:5-methylcytosine-specific restriction protein A [Vibrio diazotrophicus]|uniref:5-methylcytosine-specific restriction protein A n=1 Tax=Vibrio diazotrophicus TaxID=685 RepID=A0A329E4V3_VIBDI|nr:HNH endonuclease [Vibrio diazotrophicus]RAS59136.1 5-methylcytosine-specific restriction protein A [Vibrio diazotrophicus]
MIESEFEYKSYLRNVRNLAEGTCNSYPTYLNAICNHLRIDITSENITDMHAVKSILERLKISLSDKNYWGNCQSALRAYLAFLENESNNPIFYPEEYYEGQTTTVQVNRYERNARARRECINHHKPICKVCEIDFSNVYGEIGIGFIHVHHIKPLSDIGKHYVVNPINDLVPVCPNCHAMLHSKNPPLKVEELKGIMSSKGT